MAWSLVQGVLCLCKKYYEYEEEARAQQRAVDPLRNEINEMKICINRDVWNLQ
jgi:hypothetical protein